MDNYKLYDENCQLETDEIIATAQPKKVKNLELSEIYRMISRTSMGGDRYAARADRVAACGSFLEIARPENGGDGRLISANFCKDRLCPMCNWRKSLKTFGQLSTIISHLQHDYKFIFLTLTVPNVAEWEIGSGLDKLFKSWQLMTNRKPFKMAVRGYFRTLEITAHDREFHPHFHVILAVDPSYFTQSRIYLSHDKWTALWCDCCAAAGFDVPMVKNPKTGENMPFLSVDVRRVKSRKRSDDDNGAVEEVADAGALAEVSKYAAKDADYIGGDLTAEDRAARVFFLSLGLAGRRLISLGGVFAKMRKKLEMDDPETGDLTDHDQISETVWYMVTRWGWHGVGYVAEQQERMTGDDIKKRQQERRQAARARAAAERQRARQSMNVAIACKNERRARSIAQASRYTFADYQKFHDELLNN